jgi:hypothetical protein
MSDFFKPWRRKIGVVTLVMAGTLAIAWCSSSYSLFWVRVAVSQSSGIQVVTGDGCLTVLLMHNASSFYSFVAWGSRHNPQAIYVFERTDYVWLLRSPHIRYGQDKGPKGRIVTVSVSFSLIVIPLTLLSAYLILVKPRVAKPAKKNTAKERSQGGSTSDQTSIHRSACAVNKLYQLAFASPPTTDGYWSKESHDSTLHAGIECHSDFPERIDEQCTAD